MLRFSRTGFMRIIRGAFLVACVFVVSARGADWTTHSGNNQRNGWQRDETRITKDTLKNLQLLWKVKLDVKQRSVYSLFGPLIVERAITDRGFKELAFVATANNDLVAIDADLGTTFWTRHFDWQAEIPETQQESFLCPGGLTAWPVLPPPARGRGGRGPAAPPAAPVPVPPPGARGAQPVAPAAPQRANSPFAIRPIFVLSSDGFLHQ